MTRPGFEPAMGSQRLTATYLSIYV
jgi:hypothetical protein